MIQFFLSNYDLELINEAVFQETQSLKRHKISIAVLNGFTIFFLLLSRILKHTKCCFQKKSRWEKQYDNNSTSASFSKNAETLFKDEINKPVIGYIMTLVWMKAMNVITCIMNTKMKKFITRKILITMVILMRWGWCQCWW